MSYTHEDHLAYNRAYLKATRERHNALQRARRRGVRLGRKIPTTAKLTKEAVEIIRASEPYNRKELAARFGVNANAITDVRCWHTWKHVR